MPSSIDVVMLTKNGGNLLKGHLTSVYENVPVNRSISVSGFSSDGPYCVNHTPPEAWTINGSINTIVENPRFGLLQRLESFVAYAFYTAYTVFRSLSRKTKRMMSER